MYIEPLIAVHVTSTEITRGYSGDNSPMTQQQSICYHGLSDIHQVGCVLLGGFIILQRLAFQQVFSQTSLSRLE